MNTYLPIRWGWWLAFWLLILSPSFSQAQFAKGADISWITEQENSGVQFYNDNGSQQDIFQILGDHGMNAIRLRVWVNPSDGYCNLNDVLAKAIRARDAGMRILIDFHYSDSWADPGKQYKPAAWANYSFQQLMDVVYSYTVDVLTQLQNNGIYPEWVQIGNETNDGMLWPEGRASQNMQNFAWLVTTGHNAVKAVNSSIQTIVHISNGHDNGLFQWIIGGIINNGAQFDVIGMSLYPTSTTNLTWQQAADACLANMQDMKSRYGKEVMIAEIGMPSDQPEDGYNLLSTMIDYTQSVDGLGIFYWEPQAYGNWKGYGLDAWQDNGRPSYAMDAFLEGNSGGGCNPSSITPYVQVDGGSWGQSTNISINAGSSVKFGPQPTEGTWNWSGCGTSGSSREQTIYPTASCAATATFTNSCGEQSTVTFNVTVTGGGNNNETVRLQNRGTGLFLDGMGRTVNGEACGQYANTTHVNAYWEMIDVGSGYYQLRNSGTGLYLDGMGRTTNGSDVGQWANTTHHNSHWSLQQYEGVWYRLQNRGTGLYLDGMGRSGNGDACGQWGNTTHPNAQWQLVSGAGSRLRMEEQLDSENSAVWLASVYPNPSADGVFTIDFGHEVENGEVTVLDYLGRQVYTSQLEKKARFTSDQSLNRGMYMVILNINNERMTKRLLVK